MDIEFDEKLSDGRTISAVAHAVIDYRCQCCDQPHIERIDYDSMIDNLTGLDVHADEINMTEVETEADYVVYAAIEREAEAGVA